MAVLWLYAFAAFLVQHSEQIEREYEIAVTFTGISWSEEYADNQTAVDMLIRSPLQADNAGIRRELEDAFRGQSDFIMYQSLSNGKLWNDDGKVRTNRNAVIFGSATHSSTDPVIILQRILKEGKLGTLPVDNNTFVIAERVYERKYEIIVTFTEIPWSDEYQDGLNQTAVDMLIRGQLQADNAGIRKELEDAFRGEPHFMRYKSLYDGRLWNDSGKVRTNRNALIYGGAFSSVTDPLVTLKRVLEDGKLGALAVDNNTLELKEFVSAYQFGEWKTISGSCSLNCCSYNGSITQGRTCSSKVSGFCSGVLLRRELSCEEFCEECIHGDRFEA